MANVVARPDSLNDYLMHQIGEMDLEPDLAEMAERIISSLDAADGGYLKINLEDLLPPDATAEASGNRPQGTRDRAKSRSPRRRRPRPARMSIAAAHPDDALL